MKGMIEEIGWAMITLLAVVAIALMAFIIFISYKYFQGLDVQSRQIEFVSMAAKPYYIAHSLANYVVDGRPFIEHATDMVTTGSEPSRSLTLGIRNFMDMYNLKYYNVEIVDYYGNKYFSIENRQKTCGENNEGFCSDITCGVAMVSQDDGGYCGKGLACCRYDENGYLELSKQGKKIFNVVKCGGQSEGYCDSECNYFGSIKIDDTGKKCSGVNEGKTPVCCKPKTKGNLNEIGLGAVAQIPLFYRGRMLYDPVKTYSCQDRDARCDGTKVEINDAKCQSGYVCCVTDVINCKPDDKNPKTEDYVCMNNQECTNLEKSYSSNPDLCPSAKSITFRCCIGQTEIPSKEGTEPQSIGSCSLGGSAYYGRPAFGYIEVMVSG
jgi:hypothetical protein